MDKHWAKRLKQARIKARMTYEEVSLSTAIPVDVLTLYERRNATPIGDHLHALNRLFNLKEQADYPVDKAQIPHTIADCFKDRFCAEPTPFRVWLKQFARRFTGSFQHSHVVRTTMFLLLAGAGLAYLTDQFVSEIFFMSALTPLLWLLVLYAMTKEDNMGAPGLIYLFVLGGLASIGLVYLFRAITGYPGGLGGDILTGLIEEAAKVIIVYHALKRFKVVTVKGGILVGVAIGAGFDVFETADYGVMVFLEAFDYGDMYGVLIARGMYALAGIGHHFWTGVLAGTLVYIKKTRIPNGQHFRHPVFIQMFLLIALIHAIWNFTVVSIPWMSYGVVLLSLLVFLAFYRVAELEERYNAHTCKLELLGEDSGFFNVTDDKVRYIR
ncbi:MAG: PrsW family intramembrane metalloprotease [Acholeplasmatales bacterium]|nr:MAG: PrsW family intramembrane metalloprotease [Acholeplasmatales bacterium]